MTTPNIPAEPTIPSENPPNSALETFYLTVPFISILLGIVLGLLS